MDDQLSLNQVEAKREEREKIRNVGIFGSVDHGKGTLMNHLGEKFGLDLLEAEREAMEKGPSFLTPLYYEVPLTDTEDIGESQQVLDPLAGKGYLVNLIKYPFFYGDDGELSSLPQRSLPLIDGAVLVVDCVEGLPVYRPGIQQIVAHQINPVLMVNKIDRIFLELFFSPEECYQHFFRLIENVNVDLGSKEFGDVVVDPSRGNVVFGSGLHRWGFSLNQFASIYAKKFGVRKEQLLNKFWGDNYFDPDYKKWRKNPVSKKSGKQLQRGWNLFIFKPLQQLLCSIMDENVPRYEEMLGQLNIKLTKEEKILPPRLLTKVVMQKFLPLDAVLQMIIYHLPSPLTAQKSGVKIFGGLKDEMQKSIRDCDPNGPLIMYISRFFPTADFGSLYAFGRVFSGRIKPGQKVRILEPSSSEEREGQSSERVLPVNRVVFLTEFCRRSVADCPCGNITAFVSAREDPVLKGGLIIYSE